MTEEHEVTVETAKRGRKPKAETVAMKLLKNYRPLGDFLIEDEAAEDGLRKPTDLEVEKVPAGTVIHVLRDEARTMKNAKIAELNDEF